MSNVMTESEVEEMALDIFKEMGYSIINGQDMVMEGPDAERKSASDVVLIKRLKEAVDRINPKIPKDAREEAVKRVLRSESQKLVTNNQNFHWMVVNGIDVEYRKDGRDISDKVWLFDFANQENNGFLAVNQFTIIENGINRRPDIILFINGLPIVIIELKNPADENATLKAAYNQTETYKKQIPTLFNYNEVVVISDGMDAKAGTITSNYERFMPWKTIDGTKPQRTLQQMEVLVRGMFDRSILLDLIRHFVTYEKQKDTYKILAAYHQYHAVNKAIDTTKKASKPSGNKRCGVVWHTQGSGKSLSMVFYTGKLVLEHEMENPTVVVLTDRNDLDDQLFGTFSRSQEILRQKPVQSDSRDKLKTLLKRSSGGIIFTTIQKFLPEDKGDKYPLLSERRNIIVIADEAHRSQYDFIDGFARHMRDALPNASFIGFTGTPIEKSDRSTPAVFGDYIDIYDIQQSVEDGATVRIYYESRLAKLELKPKEKLKIDPEFDEVTEGEEAQGKEKLKSKWARVEAIVGSEKRVKRIANDIVDHFEKRLGIMDGKGMVVCMSRRICTEIYNEIVRLRPQWKDNDDKKGLVKVIMTGSATDPVAWQEHIRNKERRSALGDRMKDPDDPLKLVIVRDMWLTGFDVPNLHTMYIDKPMRGHGLMQSIARVNRVFKDKPGGLVVDYIGIADELRKAVAEYTESGGKGKPTFNQEDAVDYMIEKFEVVSHFFHGFSYKSFFGADARSKMHIIAEAEEHILKQKEGKKRYQKYVAELSKAFALAVPHEKAMEIRDDVGFFQAVKTRISKFESSADEPKDMMDTAIKQIISKAITSDKVIDIFAAAGISKPDISILSDEFLSEVRGMQHKNLAVELLKKLLNDEIKTRSRKNLVQSRSFAEMLERTIRKYQNRTIEAARVIEELIELAKEMRESNSRGEKLNLAEDELAFYDALETNDSAVKVLGDETLRNIARELVDIVRKNVTIDWTVKESIRAKLRVMVKKILRKYGYPPDKQEKATQTVLEQAELLSDKWV